MSGGASPSGDRACALRAEPATQSQAKPLVPGAAAVPTLRDWLAFDGRSDDELQAFTRRSILAFEDFTGSPVTDWDALHDGAQHGIIRLSAYQARGNDFRSLGDLPAAVAALWRPWRTGKVL